MSDPSCFLQLTENVCISQANAVSAAFVTSVASLVAVVLKYLLDGRDRRAREEFESDERGARESFEAKQQEKLADEQREQQRAREKFESDERGARESFEAKQQEKLQVHRKDLEEFVSLKKWSQQRWERKRAQIEEAHEQLKETVPQIVGLVERGPYYEDLEMIKATAIALDSFAKFKGTMHHYCFTGEFAEQGADLVDHITELLLTLSPIKSVRQSEDRIAKLELLREGLLKREADFASLCADFEKNPQVHDEDKDDGRTDAAS